MQFELVGWPADFPLPSPPNPPSSTSWHWLCPLCIQAEPLDLVGRAAKVWWMDDEQYYTGELVAYDAGSGRHCVSYEDGEWEFLNLGIEPVLLSNARSTLDGPAVGSRRSLNQKRVNSPHRRELAAVENKDKKRRITDYFN